MDFLHVKYRKLGRASAPRQERLQAEVPLAIRGENYWYVRIID